jgi:hypothetical protein
LPTCLATTLSINFPSSDTLIALDSRRNAYGN